MGLSDRPLVWLHGEIKTPPFSLQARVKAGVLLRWLQAGHKLSLPQSRPMPEIGAGCHELRIPDIGASWRILYRLDPDAVVIVEVFQKKTPETPHHLVEACQRRVRDYDRAIKEE